MEGERTASVVVVRKIKDEEKWVKSVDREGSMTWDQKGTGSAVPPR